MMRERLTAWLLLGALLFPAAVKAADAVPDSENAQMMLKDQERSHDSRYLFAGAALTGLSAVAFGYWSYEESRRARTVQTADDVQLATESARMSWATSALLASVTVGLLVYGLILEFLPQPVADKASLTFHF